MVKEKKRKQDTGRIIRAAFSIVLPLAFWFILTVFYKDFLLKVESGSLFLLDWQPLLESFSIPGGLLGWLGTFFMQFLHLPWLGALIWTVMLMVSVPLTAKAFRIPGSLWCLAAVPAFLLAMGNMSLGYAIFVIKGTGWFFVPTLGYLAAAATVLLSGRMKGLCSRIILLALAATAGFWLAGCYALSAVVLAGIMAFRTDGRRGLGTAAAAIVLAAVAPVVIYPLFTTYRLADSWTMGLPSSDIAGLMRLRFAYLLVFVSMAAAGLLAGKAASVPEKDMPVQICGVAGFLLLSWLIWYNDPNFMSELAMAGAADNCDWKKTASILEKAAQKASKSDERAFNARAKALEGISDAGERDFITDKYSGKFFEPTRPMVLLKDLALFKLGVEGDKAFLYRDGDRKQKSATQVPMVAQIGKLLYFHYGMPNYCHRWCIEEAVEYGWSYQNLRYMAMTAMAMEEWDVAGKFLDKLSSTMFYRKWARQQKDLIDAQAVSGAAPYCDVRPLMCYEDRLSSDMAMVETYIMKHFTQFRSPYATAQYDRAAMLWTLRMQDIPTFWRCFYCYLETSNPKSLPRHYQEAAYMYSTLEKSSGMQDLPYDKSVKEGYDAFMKFSQSHPVRSLDESRYQFMKKFGGTFYFYYYFTRNQETF